MRRTIEQAARPTTAPVDSRPGASRWSAVAAVAALLAVLLTGPLSLAWAAPASAADWAVIPLTSGAVWDDHACISGHRLVFSRSLSGDEELMVLSLPSGEIRQLTDNAVADIPSGFAGPYAVWTQGTDTDAEIYLYDARDDGIGRLTANTVQDAYAQTDGVHVVWNRLDAAADGGDWEVVLYDTLSGDKTRITDDSLDDYNPQVEGDYVVWQRGVGTHADILTYRISTGETWSIQAIDAVEDADPVLSDARVAWVRGSTSGTDLFVCDLETRHVTRVTEDTTHDEFPHLDGDILAWRKGGMSDPAIWYHDLATDATVFVSDDVYSRYPISAQVGGDWVAWQGGSTDDFDVFAYNVRSGGTDQVTASSDWDESPRVANNRILWTVYGGDRRGISIATYPLFTDAGRSHAYYDAIQGLATSGYVVGYDRPDGRLEFRPADPVKRAQFAKMICAGLQLDVDEDMVAPFTDLGPDVPDNLYPHEYVASAYEAGITVGSGGGRFSPYADITRAQVITMMVRAAQSLRPGGLETPPASYRGTLGSFDPTHGVTMRMAEYNGLLEGLTGFGSGWNPWSHATRGETAQMIWNLLGAVD